MIGKFSQRRLSFEKFENEFSEENPQFPEGLTIMGDLPAEANMSISHLASMVDEFGFLKGDQVSVKNSRMNYNLMRSEMKLSESGNLNLEKNLRQNEMEIIHENRKNMGIGQPDQGSEGSHIDSEMDFGTPDIFREEKQAFNPVASHIRIKSSNMLGEVKVPVQRISDLGVIGRMVQRPVIDGLKRCESNLLPTSIMVNGRKQRQVKKKRNSRVDELMKANETQDSLSRDHSRKNNQMKDKLEPLKLCKEEVQTEDLEEELSEEDNQVELSDLSVSYIL